MALWRLTLPLVPAPMPTTVSLKVSVSSAAGAVKTGRAVSAPLPASYVTVVPADWDQEYVMLAPQGSSCPAAASATPRVTLPPCTTSIPASAALATGTKRALPGLPCSDRVVRPVSFSKISRRQRQEVVAVQLEACQPGQPVEHAGRDRLQIVVVQLERGQRVVQPLEHAGRQGPSDRCCRDPGRRSRRDRRSPPA